MVQLRRTSASLQLLQSVLLKHYYLNDWHNFNDMIKFLINVLLHYYFQFWKWRSAKDVFQECAVYCPIIKELCVPSSAVFEVLHLCVCLAWAWRRTALQQMQRNWGTTWTQVVKWAFQDNQCVFTIHSQHMDQEIDMGSIRITTPGVGGSACLEVMGTRSVCWFLSDRTVPLPQTSLGLLSRLLLT